MKQEDLALLLANLAGTYATTALIGKLTGDDRRDVRLMGATGLILGGLAATLQVVSLA